MFKSRKRPITVPQAEHARLAGFVAQFWGNIEIDPPPVDPASFTLGVTCHDRGYGHLDTMPIGEVSDAVWLATQRRGILMSLDDPIADTVALMHIRRLLSDSDHADVPEIIALADERLAHNIARTAYSHEDFERADMITRLCDKIAIDFCREQPAHFESPLFLHADGTTQLIDVVIDDGRIRLHPWPLSVPEVRGFILGYTLAGYPDHLLPVMMPFIIRP